MCENSSGHAGRNANMMREGEREGERERERQRSLHENSTAGSDVGLCHVLLYLLPLLLPLLLYLWGVISLWETAAEIHVHYCSASVCVLYFLHISLPPSSPLPLLAVKCMLYVPIDEVSRHVGTQQQQPKLSETSAIFITKPNQHMHIYDLSAQAILKE